MKIVFFGDSVTQGCFEIVKNTKNEWELIIEPEYSYANIVAGRLGEEYPDRDITVINAGISGDSTRSLLNRIDRDVISEKPDITVVCIGLNNSGRKNIPEYASELSEIFERLKKAGSRVIFLTPNMLNTYVDPDTPDYLMDMAADCTDIQNGGEFDRLVKAGIETAEKQGAAVCDAYGQWKKYESYGIDTTALLCNHINHPKREMHKLFADLVMDELRKEI